MTTLTDRYVAATLSRLPEAKRADIDRELRASIADAVDDRVAAGEDPSAAEHAVLSDLGDPARLAAGYADRLQHLIGPAYYLDYTRLLRTLALIVLPSVAFAVTLAQVLSDKAFGSAIGTAVGATATTAVHLFFWVTLAFAAIERGAMRKPLPLPKWTPEALPEGPPTRRAEFQELIGVTVATAVLITALFVSPQFSSARDAAGEPIGLFDPWLWENGAVYAFSALVLASLAVRYVRYYQRWRLPSALLGVAIDLALGGMLIWVGANEHLLNPAFASDAGWAPVAVDWANRGIMIAGAIVIITSIVENIKDYRRRAIEVA